MSKFISIIVLISGLIMSVYSADTTDWKYAYHKESMVYYVSLSGNDDNPGTIDKPFRRIQKAAEIMLPGDLCYVRAGTYRETVRPLFGGMMGRPVRFEAYPGEVVTLSGTEPISGQWSKHSGSIYKIKVDREFDQLFVDGEMMIEARWPNARFDELLDNTTWATADKGSTYGKMVDEEMAKTGIDWTGALATLNVSHQFFTWTREVRKHEPGSDFFEYDRDFPGLTYNAPWDDDQYFLSGKLEALDMPTEWHLDKETQTLYLWAPDGDSPANHQVEVKVRDYAFDISGGQAKDYFEIADFHFFAATFTLEDCNYCVVENCHLRFPAYSKRVTEQDAVSRQTARTRITGSYNIIRNCSLAHGANGGFFLSGPHNIVDNCLIRDVCWSGSISYSGISIRPGTAAGGEGGCIVRRCTVHDVGYGCIAFRGPGTIIEYCDTYNAGLLSQDVQCIGTGWEHATGSIIRYNWVHDCRASSDVTGHTGDRRRGGHRLGIRGDDQTRGMTVHHNVVWNCGTIGIVVKGDYNRVYNNTSFNNGETDLVVFSTNEPYKPWRNKMPQSTLLHQENVHTEVYNNYVPVLRGQYPHQKPIRFVGGKKQSNYQGNELVLADPDNYDFRPKRPEIVKDETWFMHVKGEIEWSPIIDQGVSIPGITDGFKGFAPDIGAYEYGGENWIPGCQNFVRIPGDEIVLLKGERNTIKVRLALPPAETVAVNARPDSESMEIKENVLEFTPENWMIAQEIEVVIDSKMRSAEPANIEFSGKGLKTVNIQTTIP